MSVLVARPAGTQRTAGQRHALVATTHMRLMMLMMLFGAAVLVVIGRLMLLAVFAGPADAAARTATLAARGDIVDRNPRLGLTDVRDLRPTFADIAVHDPKSDLWKTDTDACCNIRKVIPLDKALAGFDAWLTGRKRFHGGDRLRLSVVEEAEHQLKFNPLANWAKEDLDAYVAEHDLPTHPLVAQGFPSIGCWPCTNPVEEGQDVRAGRWAGQDKTECGIHVARAPTAPNVGGGI